jgi:hypothetical protein
MVALRSCRAVIMAGWEGTEAVGASWGRRIAWSRGAFVLISSNAALAAAGESGALGWIAVSLASRVVADDRRLLDD